MQALFRRAQLKALVSIHSREEGLGGTLTSDEIAIIGGALDMTGKTASACMTPLDKACDLRGLFPMNHALVPHILCLEVANQDEQGMKVGYPKEMWPHVTVACLG